MDQDSAGKKRRIILFGNAGMGKSTLLNSMANAALFKSGASSNGQGVTQAFSKQVRKDGVELVDTPGLADPAFRKEACKECTDALRDSEGTLLTVLFVVKQDHFRVSPEHRTSMRLVLEAAGEIKSSYGVIVNECLPDTMRLQGDIKCKEAFREMLLRGMPEKTQNIYFLPYTEDWLGEDKVPKLSPECLRFIDGIPRASVTKAVIRDIAAESYEELQATVKASPEESESFQKALKEGSEKLARADAEARQNFWLGMAALPLIACAIYPATMTAFGLRGWDSYGVGHLALDRGRTMALPVGLAPYLCAFAVYKLCSVYRAFQPTPRSPEDDFRVRGRRVQPPCFPGHLKIWHVWLLQQLFDGVADVYTLVRLLHSSQEEVWIPVAWAVTLVPALLVPPLYAAKCIRFPEALVYAGIFEDSWQALIGFVHFSAATHPTMMLTFSAFFAFLRLFELAGAVRSWLKQGDESLYTSITTQDVPERSPARGLLLSAEE